MRRFSLLLLLFLGVVAVQSQTLEECRRLAREHYPEIRQYDLIAQTEQYNLSNAARAWIPQVVLSGQATYQSATPTYPEVLNSIIAANGLEMSGIRKDQYKVVIDVTQNIWDGGQSAANRALAEAEANEQRRQIDVNLYSLESRVDDLYFGILLLDERVAQTVALIDVLNSNLSRMRAYYNNGVATQADVDAIEAELLTAQQTLEQVKTSQNSYRAMLELFIGQEITSEQLARPEVTAVSQMTSARPELALFDARSSMLTAQRKALDTSIMPRFSAFAQGYYGYPGLDMFNSMVNAEWTLNAIVGVRMSWNIGAFYTRSNNIEKLNIAQRQIDVQRDVFLFNTDIQATHDNGEIHRLHQAVENDNRIVSLRRSVRMAAESKLENGVIDATDLLQKITDETTAMLNRSTHEIELLQAVYRLKHTLNQ